MGAGHPLGEAAGARLGPIAALGEVNAVYLMGRIVTDPQRVPGADGVEVTLLLITFNSPVGDIPAAHMEIEVPDDVAGRTRPLLAAGVEILTAGALVEPGLLVATFLHAFID
jgi:hypothetical protein